MAASKKNNNQSKSNSGGRNTDASNVFRSEKGLTESVDLLQKEIENWEKINKAKEQSQQYDIAEEERLRKKYGELDKLKKKFDSNTEALKRVTKAARKFRNEIDDITGAFDDAETSLQSFAELMKKLPGGQEAVNKKIEVVREMYDSVNTTMKNSVELTGDQLRVSGKLLKMYAGFSSTITKVNSLHERGRMGLREQAKTINEMFDSYDDLVSILQKGGEDAKNLAKQFNMGEKEFESFIKAARKTKNQLELLDGAMDQLGSSGIPLANELSTAVKSIGESSQTSRAAIIALSTAISALIGKYAPGFAEMNAGFQAQNDLLQEQIELTKQLAQSKYQGAFIPLQKDLDVLKNVAETLNNINRAQIDASFAGERASNAFAQSLQDAAVDFQAASKTALFGDKIGGVGYAAAKLQLAGVGADKIAEATKAAAASMGRMPTADVAASMQLLADRSSASLDDIIAINSAFSRLEGISEDVALNFQEGLRLMAKQAGIGLNDLMKEVAEASKDNIQFQLKSVDAIARQAAYAESIGVSYNEILKAGRSMVLNYKESMKAEMRLSAMLGRRVDLSEVRKKFYQGDIPGAMTALKGQGLDPTKMNMFAMDLAQQALGGMNLMDLQKINERTGKEVGPLTAEKIAKANAKYLDRIVSRERTQQTQKAIIQAKFAVIDAELSGKITNAYLNSPGYIDYQNSLNQLSQEQLKLDSLIQQVFMAGEEYNKSLVDSTRLQGRRMLTENLVPTVTGIIGTVASTFLTAKMMGFGGKGPGLFSGLFGKTTAPVVPPTTNVPVTNLTPAPYTSTSTAPYTSTSIGFKPDVPVVSQEVQPPVLQRAGLFGKTPVGTQLSFGNVAGSGFGSNIKSALGSGGAITGGVVSGLTSGFMEFSENKQLGLSMGENIGRTTVKAISSGVGGWGGASLGAAIGTAIFPGVGTLLGGLVGGWLGGTGGDMLGDAANTKFFGDKQEQIRRTEEKQLQAQNSLQKNIGQNRKVDTKYYKDALGLNEEQVRLLNKYNEQAVSPEWLKNPPAWYTKSGGRDMTQETYEGSGLKLLSGTIQGGKNDPFGIRKIFKTDGKGNITVSFESVSRKEYQKATGMSDRQIEKILNGYKDSSASIIDEMSPMVQEALRNGTLITKDGVKIQNLDELVKYIQKYGTAGIKGAEEQNITSGRQSITDLQENIKYSQKNVDAITNSIYETTKRIGKTEAYSKEIVNQLIEAAKDGDKDRMRQIVAYGEIGKHLSALDYSRLLIMLDNLESGIQNIQYSKNRIEEIDPNKAIRSIQTNLRPGVSAPEDLKRAGMMPTPAGQQISNMLGYSFGQTSLGAATANVPGLDTKNTTLDPKNQAAAVTDGLNSAALTLNSKYERSPSIGVTLDKDNSTWFSILSDWLKASNIWLKGIFDKDGWKGLEKIKDIPESIKKGLSESMIDLKTGVIGAINRLLVFTKATTIRPEDQSRFNAEALKGLGTSLVFPGYKDGKKGQISMVGENGPELRYIGDNDAVVPAGDTKRIMKGDISLLSKWGIRGYGDGKPPKKYSWEIGRTNTISPSQPSESNYNLDRQRAKLLKEAPIEFEKSQKQFKDELSLIKSNRSLYESYVSKWRYRMVKPYGAIPSDKELVDFAREYDQKSQPGGPWAEKSIGGKEWEAHMNKKLSTGEKAWAVASNPMTALKMKMNGGNFKGDVNYANLTTGIKTGQYERNMLENLTDIVNPMYYINTGKQVGTDVSHGDYLSAGIGLMNFIPGGEGKVVSGVFRTAAKTSRAVRYGRYAKSLKAAYQYGPKSGKYVKQMRKQMVAAKGYVTPFEKSTIKISKTIDKYNPLEHKHHAPKYKKSPLLNVGLTRKQKIFKKIKKGSKEALHIIYPPSKPATLKEFGIHHGAHVGRHAVHHKTHMMYEEKLNKKRPHVKNAHVDGTAFAPGGPSLVGEKGYEVMLHGGSARVIGQAGPTIMDVPKGAEIVPNHKLPKHANGTIGAEKSLELMQPSNAIYQQLKQALEENTKAMNNMVMNSNPNIVLKMKDRELARAEWRVYEDRKGTKKAPQQ